MPHPMFSFISANNIQEFETLQVFLDLPAKPIGYFVVKMREGIVNPALYYYDGTDVVRSNIDENIQEWGTFF